jgi:hypothetical protein
VAEPLSRKLKNYQRHDYQKSWRVARGGRRVAGKRGGVKDGMEQANGQKSPGGDRSPLRSVGEGPWQQRFSGFHSHGDLDLKNYQRHAIRNS